MPDDFQKRQIPQICLRKTPSGNAGRRHEGVKDKKCPKCDYATFHQTNLSAHIKAKHATRSRDKVKDEKCLHCDYTTSTKGSVTMPGQNQGTRNASFVTASSTLSGLRRHIKLVHTQIKDYRIRNVCNATLYYCLST
jgi:hypothetical protein